MADDTLADVSVSIGADLTPVDKAIDQAKPTIEGKAERLGESIASRMAKGLTRGQAIEQALADKMAALERRAMERANELAKENVAMRRGLLAKIEQDREKHHQRMEREQRRHAEAMRRSDEAGRKFMAAVERQRSQSPLGQWMASMSASNTVNFVAGMLPRFSGAGTSMGGTAGGAIGGAIGGPAGQVVGQAAGAIAGGVAGGAVDAGVGAVRYAVSQVPEASRVEQASQKFRRVLGAFSHWVAEDVDEFARTTGRSRYELRSFAADVAGLLGGFDLNSKEVARMSTELSKLAIDLASFHNISESDALQKLMSGLSGEAEPMRRLGADLRATTVEAKVLAMGLVATRDAITENHRVAARHKLILEATTNAQGDAIRSLDTYESSQRRLDAAVRDFNVGVGQLAMAAVKSLNEELAKLARQFVLTGEEATALGTEINLLLASFAEKVRKNPVMYGGAIGGPVGAIVARYAVDIAEHLPAMVKGAAHESEMRQSDPATFAKWKQASEVIDNADERNLLGFRKYSDQDIADAAKTFNELGPKLEQAVKDAREKARAATEIDLHDGAAPQYAKFVKARQEYEDEQAKYARPLGPNGLNPHSAEAATMRASIEAKKRVMDEAAAEIEAVKARTAAIIQDMVDLAAAKAEEKLQSAAAKMTVVQFLMRVAGVHPDAAPPPMPRVDDPAKVGFDVAAMQQEKLEQWKADRARQLQAQRDSRAGFSDSITAMANYFGLGKKTETPADADEGPPEPSGPRTRRQAIEASRRMRAERAIAKEGEGSSVFKDIGKGLAGFISGRAKLEGAFGRLSAEALKALSREESRSKGGHFIDAQQFGRHIQAVLFDTHEKALKAKEEKDRKEATDAAKETAKETKAVVAAVTKQTTDVVKALAGAFGYGK